MLPEGPFAHLERVAFLDGTATGTQVWLSFSPTTKQVRTRTALLIDPCLRALFKRRCRGDPSAKPFSQPDGHNATQIVVAFRGTQLDQVKDIIANADVRQTSLPHPVGDPRADYAAQPGPAPGCLRTLLGARNPNVAVHRGYYHAVLSVLDEIGDLVDMCTGGDASWSVCATGHSLGGATSTVFAYLFATRKCELALSSACLRRSLDKRHLHQVVEEPAAPAAVKRWHDHACRGVRYRVSHINFGSLRVGNAAFARQFSLWVPDSWRVENEGDIFPFVPRSMGYMHVGNGVRLLACGRVGMLDGGEIDLGALSSKQARCTHSLIAGYTTSVNACTCITHWLWRIMPSPRQHNDLRLGRSERFA